MTWVIGASPALGASGVVVSDIQVSAGDVYFDILRKAYPVGPHLIGGFAGSVWIGFQLLSSIVQFLKLPPEDMATNAWHPDFVAENWAPHARRIFDTAPNNQRDLGAQFMLVGTHPTEDVGIPGRAMVYVCRFSYPTFEPEIIRGGQTALSIGSGATVQRYTEAIRDVMSTENSAGIMQLEVNNTGGWATGMAILVSQILEDTPVDGISSHIHIHVVQRGQFKLMTNDRTIHPLVGEPYATRMPAIAESYGQLLDMLKAAGVDSAKAVC